MENVPAYPVGLTVDFPDRDLERLSTFLRLFWAIPILIILGLISGGAAAPETQSGTTYRYAAGGLLFAPVLLMILFRQKYPRWWYDWNFNLTSLALRVGAYLGLLRDEYPSTDEAQAVHVTIPYPDVGRDLNRWLPLVKWLLAIPHYFVLAFLYIGVVIAVVIAWFAILFTGRYPRALFDFVVGVLRWHLRVVGYAFLLTTDRYPPFRLSE